MQVTGPFGSAGRSGANRAIAPARSVEKSSASSNLGAHGQNDAGKQDKPTPRLQVELVCQDDTQRFDPFWDGPRLKPTFVAQLMGQVMPERRAMVAVETAYGKVAPRQALLVDRKS